MKFLALTTLTTLVALASSAMAQLQEAQHKRTFFYVGGRYIDDGTGAQIMTDQMYVEHLSPLGIPPPFRPRYPIVFIHGKAMTGSNFLNTPDGRKGWASYYLERGYDVYIVDQATRGRSAWNPRENTMSTYSAQLLAQRFTAVKQYNLWPQSQLHTQWPGNGLPGNQVFDNFYASTVQFLGNDTLAQEKMKVAGAALLDKIGPAIIVTHSQGGLFGWPIADARPNLVKAIIALEPTGPSFREAVFQTRAARPWGLTDIPMTYNPPVTNPATDLILQEYPSEGPNLVPCMLQAEPAKKWANFAKIPILIVVSEAGYHAAYDHCSYRFLKQVGAVKTEFMRLEQVGIRGNSHMFFMEKNNLVIAEKLRQWVRAKGIN